MQHILSFSYGKDSMACLGAIEKLGWKLDRIVHAEIMATPTMSANLPEMVEFKKYADEIIKKRWGIQVEHIHADKSYEEWFYTKRGITGRKTRFAGNIYGFPMAKGHWCLRYLKLSALKKAKCSNEDIEYIGIALDEPQRFGTLTEKKKSPLKEIGWTEADCRKWCEDNKLLSPIYESSARDGCWFCHFQPLGQLRRLYNNYPEQWQMMMKWDLDSPVSFRADGHSIHDYDLRFKMENMGLIPSDKTFRWKMIELAEKQQSFDW